MLQRLMTPNPRWFQVLFQAFFLSYGLLFLHWNPDWPHYVASIGGCLVFSYIAETIRRRHFPPLRGSAGWTSWGLSVLISAMSLCLLLRTNHVYTSLLAAFLTVTSKYCLRYGQKHLFNPSAFGIAATLLITGDAWLSPGQWGNKVVLVFLVVTLGAIVVTRVQKLDSSLTFLLTWGGLLYWRQVLVLGWPQDYFWHSISNGSLLQFRFFMISDPKTSPNHPVARVLWAMGIAALSFYRDDIPVNMVKCDPCIAKAPNTQDLVQAGVGWVGETQKGSQDPGNDEEAGRPAKVYFTRLHVRYNRKAFPQDLFFEETANTGNFQTRYIITHPSTGDLSCAAGKKYQGDLLEKRGDELKMLTYLTGKSYKDWDITDSYAAAALKLSKEQPRRVDDMLIAGISIAGLLSMLGLRIRNHDKHQKYPYIVTWRGKGRGSKLSWSRFASFKR